MIIKKVVVNGNEIHVQVTNEEAKKSYLNNEELIFTDETEKEQFLRNVILSTDDKEEPEEKTHQSNHKKSRIMQILPFLEDEDIHALFTKIIADEETTKDLDLVMILPFLDEKDASELFKKALLEGNTRFNPVLIAPFVDEEGLSQVVDLYIEGKVESSNIDNIYPFLSSKDVRRLFEYILSQKSTE